MKKLLLILMLLAGNVYAGNLHKLKSKQLSSNSGTLYYGPRYLLDLPVGINFLDTPLYQCIVVVPGNSRNISKIKIISCKIKPDAQKRIDGFRNNSLKKTINLMEV